ncbi:HAMP domain-containing histidine kinase [Candidatus Saccharibacteria bacterium]|nr:HAMP domain-containing histidine kinase [Candidatus Saccharibacteria bacterium]
MKEHLFSAAVIKLTLVYTTILAIICIGFSAAFYAATDQELDRPITVRTNGTMPIDPLNDPLPAHPELQAFIKARNDEMRTNLLARLVFINIAVLTLGACASYFLARHTLQPIQKMTKQQANFISDASHELRTPLTAIAMENEVALRNTSLSKPELTDIIKSNLEETKKLQNLTDRLLKLSQNEPLRLSETDLAKSTALAINNLAPITKSKHIIIKNQVKITKINSNAEALTEILTILIENAIKYSPQKSTITISFKDTKISVRDQGPGIAEEDMPHIFDRFYRAEKSRTSNGYGLGLPLAKQLASQLHLEITAANNKTTGAIFSLKPLT